MESVCHGAGHDRLRRGAVCARGDSAAEMGANFACGGSRRRPRPSLAQWIAAPARASQDLLFLLVWPLVVMLLVAFTEWILADARRWQPLAWMAACCLAAAALDRTGFLGVYYGTLPERLKPLLTAPLTALLTWSAILLGQRLAERRRATQATAAAAIAAVVIGAVVMSEWGAYELAKPSLRGDGPLTRLFAAMLLANRNSNDDRAAVAGRARAGRGRRRQGSCSGGTARCGLAPPGGEGPDAT